MKVSVWLPIALFALLLFLIACATFRRDAPPTIEKIGLLLCESYYREHPELTDNLAADIVCAGAKIAEPFIEGARMTRMTAARRSTAMLRPSTLTPAPSGLDAGCERNVDGAVGR